MSYFLDPALARPYKKLLLDSNLGYNEIQMWKVKCWWTLKEWFNSLGNMVILFYFQEWHEKIDIIGIKLFWLKS